MMMPVLSQICTAGRAMTHGGLLRLRCAGQTDLAYGDGMRYAKSCEAVQDRGTDLDFRNPPVKVTRPEVLTR
jgi:hypothetical protein